MSFMFRKWKDRLKMLLYLPFSNQALKYFPPDFTLRDPVTSLVHKSRKKGHSCGLILVHWEESRHSSAFTASYSYEMQKRMKHDLKEIIERHFHRNDIIGITQPNGDEFCVYVRDRFALNFQQLQSKAQSICKDFETRLCMNHAEKPQLLFGCCLLSAAQEDTRDALRSAYYYAQALATKKLPQHFHSLRQQLSAILHSEQISVLAQPIIRLQDGEVFGWEFLTRGPQNTPFYMPTELFNYAYQAHLLSKLEILVMEKAFQEIEKRGIQEQVFLNITAVSLTHPLFLNKLMKRLANYPSVRPQQIIFEITERHHVRDYQHMGMILRSYRDHGFRFAVDDAGAGYSSLQSISELIPDMIKIDRSLIHNIDQISVKQTMLKALMSLAEHINCQVIAEGIEREEEADMLSKYAVQMGQGYYFSHPEPLLIKMERGEYEKFKEKIKYQLKLSSA